MNREVYKKAMEIGYYFKSEIKSQNDDRIENWTGTEECATFTKAILDYAEENDCDVSFAFQDIADETVSGICNGTFIVKDHGYDVYCRGFLAGEILGYPTKENLQLVKEAEEYWRSNKNFGYYQDILNDVLNERIIPLTRK